MIPERCSGVLLHPTSLPGPYGVGQIGQAARDFIDALAAAGQRLWQVLPLNPTGYTNCPYSASSAFAGNPFLIDLDSLRDEGLLDDDECAACRAPETGRADFGHVYHHQFRALHAAHARHRARGTDAGLDRFAADHAYWLDDYACFAAIKRQQGGRAWTDWPAPLRDRDPAALQAWAQAHPEALAFERFVQFQFFRQWAALKAHAAARGVALISDIPLYVAHDSADVWAHRPLFVLDDAGAPAAKAGVPPDCFSDTGQLWGNPVYDWPAHEAEGFRWWRARIGINLVLGDVLRFDHFRGLESYWSVPGDHDTALHGRWMPVPGDAFFAALRQQYGQPLLIAEDLGIITPEVDALRERHGLLTMKIAQFGFDDPDPDNGFRPHTYPERAIAYTGSLDSDTARGWLDSAAPATRDRALAALGTTPECFAWALIDACWRSQARLAVAPMQDLLGLDSAARMNLPGTAEGNWEWRLARGAFSAGLIDALHALTRATRR